MEGVIEDRALKEGLSTEILFKQSLERSKRENHTHNVEEGCRKGRENNAI